MVLAPGGIWRAKWAQLLLTRMSTPTDIKEKWTALAKTLTRKLTRTPTGNELNKITNELKEIFHVKGMFLSLLAYLIMLYYTGTTSFIHKFCIPTHLLVGTMLQPATGYSSHQGEVLAQEHQAHLRVPQFRHWTSVLFVVLPVWGHMYREHWSSSWFRLLPQSARTAMEMVHVVRNHCRHLIYMMGSL